MGGAQAPLLGHGSDEATVLRQSAADSGIRILVGMYRRGQGRLGRGQKQLSATDCFKMARRARVDSGLLEEAINPKGMLLAPAASSASPRQVDPWRFWSSLFDLKKVGLVSAGTTIAMRPGLSTNRSFDMTTCSLPANLLYLLMGLAGSANAALVCTPGDAVGPGSCEETVSVGSLGTTEFTNQALSFDLWPSNAQPGFIETLQDVRFTFGGTVHYDAGLQNFAQSTKAGGMVITEVFDFARGSSPASFLPTDVSTTSQSGLTFALSANQAITIQIDGTFPNVAVVYTTGLDDYSGLGTFQAFVSGSTGYAFTSNPAQYADVVLQTIHGSYGTASPMVTMTYDFVTSTAPVPEPASWALMTAGFFGIGTLLRRRRGARHL